MKVGVFVEAQKHDLGPTHKPVQHVPSQVRIVDLQARGLGPSHQTYLSSLVQ